MTTTAAQIHERLVGSESNHAVGFDDLPSGVLLTGTPTVQEQGGSDLTITSVAVNTSAVTVFGTSYVAGTAVTFHRAGGAANKTYTMRVTVTTDATPADVLVGDCLLKILP